MVMGDLLRFVSIYFIFVMGFSQAYYIVFCTFSHEPEEGEEEVDNPMPSGMESFIAMFLMSLTNFGDYYAGTEHTEHEMEAKVNLQWNAYVGTDSLIMFICQIKSVPL